MGNGFQGLSGYQEQVYIYIDYNTDWEIGGEGPNNANSSREKHDTYILYLTHPVFFFSNPNPVQYVEILS